MEKDLAEKEGSQRMHLLRKVVFQLVFGVELIPRQHYREAYYGTQ